MNQFTKRLTREETCLLRPRAVYTPDADAFLGKRRLRDTGLQGHSNRILVSKHNNSNTHSILSTIYRLWTHWHTDITSRKSLKFDVKNYLGYPTEPSALNRYWPHYPLRHNEENAGEIHHLTYAQGLEVIYDNEERDEAMYLLVPQWPKHKPLPERTRIQIHRSCRYPHRYWWVRQDRE